MDIVRTSGKQQFARDGISKKQNLHFQKIKAKNKIKSFPIKVLI